MDLQNDKSLTPPRADKAGKQQKPPIAGVSVNWLKPLQRGIQQYPTKVEDVHGTQARGFPQVHTLQDMHVCMRRCDKNTQSSIICNSKKNNNKSEQTHLQSSGKYQSKF